MGQKQMAIFKELMYFAKKWLGDVGSGSWVSTGKNESGTFIVRFNDLLNKQKNFRINIFYFSHLILC